MAYMDFRSTWADLLRELREDHGVRPRLTAADQVFHEVTEELGLVEPDLVVLKELVGRPSGQVVYDKFSTRRR